MISTYLLVTLSLCFCEYNSYRLKKFQQTCELSKRYQVINFKPVSYIHYNNNAQSRTRLYNDDLPNLFGVNPIEAAAIGFILYYIYGPETLYDYARQAGKFVSTYLPIVQTVTKDIIDEFKNYFDEERQRDMLQQQGFDVSNLPRKYSNIFERLKQAFETFSESTDETKSEGIDIKEDQISGTLETGALATSLITPVDPSTKKRKKKRQVLKDDDMNEVAKIAEKASKGEASEEIAQSIEKIKTQFNAIQERTQVYTNPNRNQDVNSNSFDDDSLLAKPFPDIDDFNDYNYLDDVDYTLTTPNTSIDQSNLGMSNGMSKFQMQMSGDWNQRVLAKESQVLQSNNNEISLVNNIPEELTSSDNIINKLVIDGDTNNISNDIIKVLDEDYLKLRNRLLNLIQIQSSKVNSNSLLTSTDSDKDESISKQLSITNNDNLSNNNTLSSSWMEKEESILNENTSNQINNNSISNNENELIISDDTKTNDRSTQANDSIGDNNNRINDKKYWPPPNSKT